MAATILRELGEPTELIRGGSGVFEVVADGKTIFSKKQSGRFPEEDEVIRALRG